MTKRYAIKVSNLFERKIDDLSDYFEETDYRYFNYIYNLILISENPLMYPALSKKLRKIVIPEIKYNIYYNIYEAENIIYVVNMFSFKEEQTEKIIRRGLSKPL
jgi:hypothetical protein